VPKGKCRIGQEKPDAGWTRGQSPVKFWLGTGGGLLKRSTGGSQDRVCNKNGWYHLPNQGEVKESQQCIYEAASVTDPAIEINGEMVRNPMLGKFHGRWGGARDDPEVIGLKKHSNSFRGDDVKVSRAEEGPQPFGLRARGMMRYKVGGEW